VKRADRIVVARRILTCAPGGAPRPGSQMDDVGEIEEGALAIVGGELEEVAPARDLLRRWRGDIHEYLGCTVTPGFVDAHTHPLFAGSRAEEFVMRARGATYEEIHAAGGGISSTVRATREASDEELENRTRRNLLRMLTHGTTTVEVKSGYGLETEEELRHLRILRRLSKKLPMDMALTFLGAHAVPEEYAGRSGDFVNLVVEEMMPRVAHEGLAEWVDVFCERGAFNLEESRRVLQAGLRLGLGLRIHAEEFSYLGGARMAAELGARAADHLQNLPASDFPILLERGTIPIMTPGTSFFLGQGQYAPAREMVDADLPVGLATDFNAGSNLTSSMAMAMSLAVLRMKLTPAEALTAATVNSAWSLDLGRRVGSLEAGKQADFVVLEISDWKEWPYCYGVNLVSQVYKAGQPVLPLASPESGT
jgi:imidazolonepropionase